MADASGVSLSRKAADIGNATAMFKLARNYVEGRGGLPKDDTEAGN